MTRPRTLFGPLAAIALLASCNTSSERANLAPGSIERYNAASAPSRGFTAPEYEVLENPLSENGRPLSVLLTSKFVELETKQFKKHEVLGDVAYQLKLRRLMRTKGADLLSSPSVITNPGQLARTEIIRELNLKGAAFDETLNLGVSIDTRPAILKNGRIQLSGKSTVREVDSPEVVFGTNHAVSVQSNDTYFDLSLKPGQTAQLIMRDNGTPGQRIVFITAQLIDGQVDENGNLPAKLQR